jgi:hypothetical protein
VIVSAYLPVKSREPIMHNGSEKRQYRRIEKPFEARFRIKPAKAREMESDDWVSVTLMNLSAGGTFFYHRKDLGVGTLLDLEIDVAKSIPPINCVGKTLSSDRLQPASSFCISVSFIDIGEKEKELISKVAEGTLR